MMTPTKAYDLVVRMATKAVTAVDKADEALTAALVTIPWHGAQVVLAGLRTKACTAVISAKGYLMVKFRTVDPTKFKTLNDVIGMDKGHGSKAVLFKGAAAGKAMEVAKIRGRYTTDIAELRKIGAGLGLVTKDHFLTCAGPMLEWCASDPTGTPAQLKAQLVAVISEAKDGEATANAAAAKAKDEAKAKRKAAKATKAKAKPTNPLTDLLANLTAAQLDEYVADGLAGKHRPLLVNLAGSIGRAMTPTTATPVVSKGAPKTTKAAKAA